MTAVLAALTRGDLEPAVRGEVPGLESRRLSASLTDAEAPVVNTVVDGSPSIVWQEALGSNVVDVDGNRYVDLTSGFGAASVGHRHPSVVAAVESQSRLLLHGLGDVHAHPVRAQLSVRLRQLAPIEDAQVYYAASGADAVEIALKTAVLATGRSDVLAFDPAYHGLTLGALSVSSRSSFRQPFDVLLRRGVHRIPFAAPEDQLHRVLENHPEIGAVIFEPIVGREGVIVPPDGWMTVLAETSRAHGTVLIADEIFTGFGRTGHLFAVDAEALEVDLVCCGKALAGGLPIGVVLGRRSLFAAWDRGGEALHTSTFLANPLACAAALAVLDILDDEALPQRARRLGEEIRQRTRHWSDLEVVDAVRGRGLLWGIELRTAELAGDLSAEAQRRGYLILAGGSQGTVLQIAPPLTISDEQLAAALLVLEELLLAAEAGH